MGQHGQSVIIRDTSSGLSAPVTSKGLLVDTELTLSGDVTVENVTVARDDAGNERKLRVDGSRNTYVVTPSGIPINISGDVRLQDGDSATFADVELDSSKNALFVQSESLATESTLAGASGDIKDIKTAVESLDDALDSVGTDELKVVIADDADPTIKTAVLVSGDDSVPNATNQLVTASMIYAKHITSASWDRVICAAATSDSSPDLDDSCLLGTHALLSARKDVNTTIGLTAHDGTHNALHVALTDGETIAEVYPTGAVRVSGDVNIVTGDIQIGAVELKDADSATRADIEVDSSKGALFVQSESLASESTLADMSGDVASIDSNASAIKAAVEIMDDWDESDRAKVNPVVGQAGVSANEGVLDAKTQRITIAKDDAVATQLSGDISAIRTAVEIIDDWDESDRAMVNPIVGQAGVDADAGVKGVKTQRVTLATDDIIGTALSGDTADIKTAVELIDNAISGNEMQVDVVASLPSGDNIIGQVKAAGATGSINTRRMIVTSSPAQIATVLSGRSVLKVMNFSENDVYIGQTSAVASGDGWPVFAQTFQNFAFSGAIEPYIMAVSGSNDCRFMDIE